MSLGPEGAAIPGTEAVESTRSRSQPPSDLVATRVPTWRAWQSPVVGRRGRQESSAGVARRQRATRTLSARDLATLGATSASSSFGSLAGAGLARSTSDDRLPHPQRRVRPVSPSPPSPAAASSARAFAGISQSDSVPQAISRMTLDNQEPESDHYLFRSNERPPFRSPDHVAKAFGQLAEMKRDSVLCDVILKTDDEVKIPAHRNVLAAGSPYFYAMFTSSMAESRSPTVHIRDVNSEALLHIIDFIYTAELAITEESVQTLLPIANLLQLNTVREACCEYLQSQLHPRNCLGIQRFADIHSCTELLNYSRRFAEQHFGEVLQQGDEFLSLTREQLIELINSDHLCVSEELVFEAVLRWVRHQPEERGADTQLLFSYVRFALLPREYLLQLSEPSEFLQNNPWCKDYVIEALSYHLLPLDQKRRMTSQRVKPRNPAGLSKYLLVIGGQAPKAIRTVQCFNFRRDAWQPCGLPAGEENAAASPASSSLVVPDMPSRRCRCGVAVLNGLVYVVGGFNGALRLRSTEIYDIASNTWHTGPNMEWRRATLGVTVLNGLVYAVGGFDGTNGFNSAEVFDPQTNQWKMIAPMLMRRSSINVTVLHGKLYAVGGFDGTTRRCLASAERYDPMYDSWTSLPDMSSRRSGAAVAVLHGRLFVCGGHDGPLVLTSAESFNPETNTWHRIADMHFGRRNAGLVVHEDCLYVIGGDDGTSNLNTIERYDPVTNSWIVQQTLLMYGISYGAVAVIDRSTA